VVPKFWMYVLATALAADVAVSGPQRVVALRSVLSGDWHGTNLMPVVALVASLVAVVAGVVLARAALRTEAELERRARLLDAASAASDTDAASRRRLDEVRQRVHATLAERDVEMALQPLVSLVTGEIAGVEALARFRDGRGPDQWFAEAQECGKVRELDELTFRTALDLISTLPPDVYLSVNASPDLLVDRGFCAGLVSSGLPLDRLVIEITEHAQVPDYPALKAAVDGLRAQGVRFAIDDTGAGYASLNHVLQLRPDIIKLDRALITDVADDPARRALVTALVLLALEIGASVTGEGVETADQLSALSTLGVDHAQGYLLARPSTDSALWRGWWGRRWIGALPVGS
jgi:EAL domain-containing protein (putative c-di-GMP-specific phosphodiesterase class I)